jgi:NAD(P)-dependent dehydrogenase (short-subunit alcohol dehydrogenase family)
MSIENRVTLITGATGGLGQVVTRTFAREGARLALLGRNAERLKALSEELDLPEEHVLAHAVNVNDPVAAREAVQVVLERFERVDILLHLVGGWVGGKPLVEVAAEDLEDMIQQHIWSAFHMVQAVVPHLLANQWGRVIAISSPSASRPPGKNAPYAIGKAALEALMSSLAQEVKGTDVTANVIQVNLIDVKHERDRNPSPRNASWTTPEEIAAALAYLCSDGAGMINGARIPLYGSP